MASWLFLYTEDSEGMGYGWRIGDCNAVPHKIGKPRDGAREERVSMYYVDGALEGNMWAD